MRKDSLNLHFFFNIQFFEYKKPTVASIEENNTLLWAKKIFKTKPNHEVDSELKTKVKTIFHHLTKDELIEKLLANHLKQMIAENAPADNTPQVVSTIATEREGIAELLNVITAHQLAIHDSGAQKNEMLFTKVMQLIMASKMNQVDIEKLKLNLASESSKAHFNIFKFAQTFY